MRSIALVVFISSLLAHTNVHGSGDGPVPRSVFPYLEMLQLYKASELKDTGEVNPKLIAEMVKNHYFTKTLEEKFDESAVERVCQGLDNNGVYCRPFMELVRKEDRLDAWKEGCQIHRQKDSTTWTDGNQMVQASGPIPDVNTIDPSRHHETISYLEELALARGKAQKKPDETIVQSIVAYANTEATRLQIVVPTKGEMKEACEMIGTAVSTCKPYVETVPKLRQHYKMWQDGCRIYYWSAGPPSGGLIRSSIKLVEKLPMK